MLTGCGAARPSKCYQLTVPAASTSVTVAPYRVTLLVGPITASHLFRDDQIVYRSTGQAVGTYESHRWAEPPPEMIEDILVLRARLRRTSLLFRLTWARVLRHRIIRM